MESRSWGIFAGEPLFGWVQKPDRLGGRLFDGSTVDFCWQRDVLSCPSFDFPFGRRPGCGNSPPFGCRPKAAQNH